MSLDDIFSRLIVLAEIAAGNTEKDFPVGPRSAAHFEKLGLKPWRPLTFVKKVWRPIEFERRADVKETTPIIPWMPVVFKKQPWRPVEFVKKPWRPVELEKRADVLVWGAEQWERYVCEVGMWYGMYA